jgi:predicted kinase
MCKAIITVGISASGKTTFAKTLVEQGWVDINRDWIRFHVVCPGADWSNYKFTKKREQDVTVVQEDMVMDAFSKGQNIIISDTNLNPKIRNKWIQSLTDLGFEVEIKEFPVTLEEAYKRDTLRANGVGRDVIYTQYKKWLEYTDRKTYVPNTDMPKAILLDIDGTVAQTEGRSPFEWDKVSTDKPRQFVIDIVKGLSDQGYVILALSGRDGVCYDDTKDWLLDNDVPYFYLFMREKGDTRKDTVVKEEIFWDLIAEHWNVVGVLDDRPCVLRTWREIGIKNVIAVADPYLEF